MLRRFSLVAVLLFASPSAFAATQGGSVPVPLPLFPPNNWWNTDITNAPTALNSSDFINFIGANDGMHPDFGGDSGEEDYPIYGFPFIVVEGNQPKKTVTFIDEEVREECDGVDHNTNTSFPFYPVPDEAITMMGWVEGGQPGNVDRRDDADRHILIVDKTNNHLYELYNVWYNGTNWEAYSGAFFDMNTNNRRTEGWTSADASGMAMLPGLVRYDEVFGPDEIRHAFRVTVHATNGHVYPASHTAGSTSGAPPMGMRLRLKPGINISGFTPEMQRIFRAMKRYGLIVADNGTDMYVSGTYDTRWDNDILNPAFDALEAEDFEVIQLGWQPSVTLVLTMPDALGAGDPASATLTAYDSNGNVATGYTGTVHFTATDGTATLPVNYTFIGTDAGVHTFPNGFVLNTAGSHVITVTDTVTLTITGSKGVRVGPPTPTGFTATAVSPSQVNLAWSASAGATQYEVFRRSATSGGAYVSLTTVGATAFSDATVVAPNAYVYKVRALDASSRVSPLSAPDAATTTMFTNDPIVALSTAIKSAHITELRTAVNALRATAGLSASTFTDAALSSSIKVKAVHVQELRNALAAARTSLELPAVSFTDPTLTAGSTKAKAVHVTELRNGVK
jgi:hypothetical protein